MASWKREREREKTLQATYKLSSHDWWFSIFFSLCYSNGRIWWRKWANWHKLLFNFWIIQFHWHIWLENFSCILHRKLYFEGKTFIEQFYPKYLAQSSDCSHEQNFSISSDQQKKEKGKSKSFFSLLHLKWSFYFPKNSDTTFDKDFLISSFSFGYGCAAIEGVDNFYC